MVIFTSEHIKQLDNPYQELDLLIEHSDELEKLSFKEMKKLAEKMLLACPQEDMNSFGHAINALRLPGSKFYPILRQAYEIKKRILALLDPSNPKPYLLLINEEFNEAMFYEFNKLALNLLKNNEVTFATQLALTTPMEHYDSLSRNLSNVFPQSMLVTKVKAAFGLRRDIEHRLLGETPQDFFTNEEFNPELCGEFSVLFFGLIKGYESVLEEKLLHPQVIEEISDQLEILNDKIYSQPHPFRLNPVIMPQVESSSTRETVSTEVRNRYRHFNGSPREENNTNSVSVRTQNSESGSNQEREDYSSTFHDLFKW